ncbi:hypothetical protein evm_007459 [Chilo suppressalis]|nr:hypothetical protein evm_007459 [Chilo suppressalis]
MPGQRCVICGRGYGTGTTVHTFPNPNKFPERFKEWVQIIGGKLETPSDYEFYKKKRICDVHFIEQHKTSCHRLSALAVPSLYLPGSTDIQQRSPIIANTSMSIPNQSDEPTMTDNQPTLVNNLSTAPSTSGLQHTSLSLLMEHNYSALSRPKLKKTVKGAFNGGEIKARQIKVLQSEKSPKCYRMLSKYFTLPSSRAMTRLLSNIKIGEGINKLIFDKIKHGLHDQDVSQRLCTLIFDEMSLTPQIFYNAAGDNLSGFAHNQKSAFTDHVLVFMVKGVRRNFKQPVAYYFTNGLKKNNLKELIRTVTEEITKTGLIIVATICDQSAVNVGAITDLVEETKTKHLSKGKEWHEDFILIKGRKIIPLYDPPHLIKGIRNNLLNKDMTYEIDGKKKL